MAASFIIWFFKWLACSFQLPSKSLLQRQPASQSQRRLPPQVRRSSDNPAGWSHRSHNPLIYIYVKPFDKTRSQVPLSVPFRVVETSVGLHLGVGTRTRIVDHVTRVLSVTLPLYEPELVTGGFTGPVVQRCAVCLFSKLAVPPVISAGSSEEELLIDTLQLVRCEFDLPHNPDWPIFASV